MDKDRIASAAKQAKGAVKDAVGKSPVTATQTRIGSAADVSASSRGMISVSRLAEDQPDRYLINMAKNRRTGRIFLDYLRNDRMSTAVAPLSPRARPGATVSMPVTWSQVRSDLDPRRLTIRITPSLLAKSTAWDGYCDAEGPIADAIARLSRMRAAG